MEKIMYKNHLITINKIGSWVDNKRKTKGNLYGWSVKGKFSKHDTYPEVSKIKCEFLAENFINNCLS